MAGCCSSLRLLSGVKISSEKDAMKVLIQSHLNITIVHVTIT